ncbi:MAG: protein kinase [Acidobacteria bacterium]|nr:protein kinase [Acidobacteriota bacterium]
MIPRTVSHYRIIDRLGAGGMGEVYLAEDTRLGRRVALKLLPARYTSDPDRVRRFEQEARAASALNHPNIVTIHEVGEAEGLHFMVTEYIEGETLRQLLRHRRPGLAETLEIAVQVAAALTAAHAAGIAHRDIKPDNIMIRPDGYVKVLDFGLAKLIEPSHSGQEPIPADTFDGPAGDLTATAAGVVLGTVHYMSPEQARGVRVDVRTDIFSFGVVLYEMIAGQLPFVGETRSDIIAEILRKPVAALSSSVSGPAPGELDWLIQRMLVKDREARYQAARSLLDDLKLIRERVLGRQPAEQSLSAQADAPASAAENRSGAERRTDDAANAQTRPIRRRRSRRAINSLAVLPFANAGTDSNAAFLSDGITESVINNLSRLPRLRVMARSTVYRYQGRAHGIDPLAVGRELGVRAVLTGRVVMMGDRLVVKVELVDADDGAHLWGEQYARRLADVFEIEEQLSQEISDQLRLRLTGDEKKRLARRYTASSEAYQSYLKGRYYWNQRTPQGLKKAIECFDAAIAFDRDYALAYAGLADAYSLLGIYSAIPARAAMPKARAAAERALAIDEELSEAHTALAGAYAFFEWNWEGAEREFLRAIQLNPASAAAHHWYASVLLTAMGRFSEAMAEQRRAKDLEPLSLVINTHLGWVRYHARDYDGAVTYCREALDLDPNFTPAHFYTGLAMSQLGRHAEAVATLEHAVELSRGGAMIAGGLGYARARAGDRPGAERVLEELQRQSSPQRYVSPFYSAMVYTGLGRKEPALDCLDRTWEERFCWLVWLRTEPMFDPLRDEPRFEDLLRRVNLAHTTMDTRTE